MTDSYEAKAKRISDAIDKGLFTSRNKKTILSKALRESAAAAFEEAASIVSPVFTMNFDRKLTDQQMWGQRVARKFRVKAAALRK